MRQAKSEDHGLFASAAEWPESALTSSQSVNNANLRKTGDVAVDSCTLQYSVSVSIVHPTEYDEWMSG